jgi:hypothetical protein
MVKCNDTGSLEELIPKPEEESPEASGSASAEVAKDADA